MNAATTNITNASNEPQFLGPQDSSRAGVKKMRISDFRDAVDSLNWNRRDLGGATRQEWLREDVRTRLQRRIDAVQQLVPNVPARFAEDLRHARESIESAKAAITRWQDARNAAAAAKEA